MTNKYCFCLSGHLGAVVLQDILANHDIKIQVVLTDRKSEEIIAIAKKNAIPTYAGNPRNERASLFCIENDIQFDYILSVNYLFILEDDFLNRAKMGINFHGSLLPKYRGRTPHVWAIINGEKETGITAHLMNAKCDDGDIVKQVRVPIGIEDTGATILGRYNEIYPELVRSVIDDIEKEQLKPKRQESLKATYYGKRTPEDGRINWMWQKERIRNWVRAQANPYPGAFTFLNDKKVIINKIDYSDYGFTDTMANGLVLAIEDGSPIVKTENGAVKLLDFESEIDINAGEILI